MARTVRVGEVGIYYSLINNLHSYSRDENPFFLRHYNDIDHITPVIYKWAITGHQCDVVLLGSAKFRRDYRIQFLKQLSGVRVAHIREVLGWRRFLMWRLQAYMLTGNVRRIPVLRSLAERASERYDQTRREQLWRETTEILLTRCFGNAEDGVIAFDWVEKTRLSALSG